SSRCGACSPSTRASAGTWSSSCSAAERLLQRRGLHSRRLRLRDELLLHRLETFGPQLPPGELLVLDVLREVGDPFPGGRVIGQVLGERRLRALQLLQLPEELDDAVGVVPGLGRVARPVLVRLGLVLPAVREQRALRRQRRRELGKLVRVLPERDAEDRL